MTSVFHAEDCERPEDPNLKRTRTSNGTEVVWKANPQIVEAHKMTKSVKRAIDRSKTLR